MESFKKIIFFDDKCVLCNTYAKWVLKYQDKNNPIFLAPIDGKFSQSHLKEEFVKNKKTLVFLKNQQIYTQSDAILEVMKDLKSFWKVLRVFKILPLSLRNTMYQTIAQNRYNWFNKTECFIPNENQKKYILS